MFFWKNVFYFSHCSWKSKFKHQIKFESNTHRYFKLIKIFLHWGTLWSNLHRASDGVSPPLSVITQNNSYFSFSMCQLHNKLMFLMDNLQHYLQADVLETNFSRLMDAVNRTNDFEKLKKAHANFLADILSQSFLTVTSVSIYFKKITIYTICYFHFNELELWCAL